MLEVLLGSQIVIHFLWHSVNCSVEIWQVKRLPYHINDPEFADALVKAFLELSHATGVAQQPREVAPRMNIQTIKPKLVKMPTSNFSHANPGSLFSLSLSLIVSGMFPLLPSSTSSHFDLKQ
jgi:hypothetical protein